MARIPVRLLIFGLLCTSPALAQSTWLHPSDREYQYAIDGAFGKGEAGRDYAQALEFIRRLPDGTNSYISVRPPLACADVNAEAQRRELGRAPTVDEVKEVCDGQLLVAVRYFSTLAELERSLIIEHRDQEIKPSRSFYDHAHAVAADDSIEAKQVQYAYLDLYFVVPDAAWDDEVTFVTGGVNGQQKALTFDFTSQVENEQQIDSASR